MLLEHLRESSAGGPATTTYQEEIFKAILADGDYIKACEMLHDPSFIENVGVENSMLNSWDMLPNPRLDPFGGRFIDEEEEE